MSQRGLEQALEGGKRRESARMSDTDRILIGPQKAFPSEQDRTSLSIDDASTRWVIGQHPSMQRLFAHVRRVAESRATVLICGETGTGKEMIAAAVHHASARRDGPFVRLNCAALAESIVESELFGHERGSFTGASTQRRGRFEQANGGTLFLDEVSEIPASVQVKLLRCLQERQFERVGGNETIEVDVRIVAASNRHLPRLVEAGKFREDLYYRLNVVQLQVPPLRSRPSDIPLLARAFVEELARENGKEIEGLTAAAEEALIRHLWPGNVRELRNAIEQAVVLCGGRFIEVDDLPLTQLPLEVDALRTMVPGSTLAEIERYAILTTLEAVEGSTSRASAMLGVSRRKIQYRLEEWGLSGYGRRSFRAKSSRSG